MSHNLHDIEYLCMGGAGSKLGAYLGVLEAFETHSKRWFGIEWNLFLRRKIKGCCGASAGSAVALCMCLALDSKEIESVIAPLMKNFRAVVPLLDVASLVHRFGLDGGDELKRLIVQIVTTGGLSADTTFRRLHDLTGREFACTATNLNTREPVLFDRHYTPELKIVDAVMASCSIPLVFAPININGDMYVDGALTLNTPSTFPMNHTMVWRLDDPARVDISSWMDYVSALVNIGMGAQNERERKIRSEAGHMLRIRMPARHRDGPAFDLSMDDKGFEEFVLCGYTSVVDSMYAKMCGTSLLLVLGQLIRICFLGRHAFLSNESAIEVGPCTQAESQRTGIPLPD